MTLTQATNHMAAVSAALTGYVLLRTVYIWYRYLRNASGSPEGGTLLGSLKVLLKKNPPPAFPSADLPIVTAALGLTSLASALLYAFDQLSAH